LGFEIVESQKAVGLQEQIYNSIKEKGLALEKLRGQGYDGAATVSGVYSGVQARIKEMQPRAIYVHCALHILNLVLNDCIKAISQLCNFYSLLERVYTFFGNSIERWKFLYREGTISTTLKRLCPTTWSSRNDVLNAIRFRFTDVLEVLTMIILQRTKSEEKAEAIYLHKKLEDSEVVVMQNKILTTIHIVSKLLQSEKQDLSKVSASLKDAYEDLKVYRNDFTSVV
jgi:hypothetical protein